MLRHIVMFNWKPEVTEEQINAVAKGFAHLAEVIDVVIEMKFGKNLAIMDGCFDYMPQLRLPEESRRATVSVSCSATGAATKENCGGRARGAVVDISGS